MEAVSQLRSGATFVELQGLLSFPKSSLFALLGTLVEMRWLLFDPSDRTYSIGVRPWEVGQSYLRSGEIVVRARPHLRDAHVELGETVQLGVLDGFDVVYIDKIEGMQSLRLVSEVGTRLPAYATAMGKVLLAELPESELRAQYAGATLEAYAPGTITDGNVLLEQVYAQRELGYASDEGEYSEGVFCIAVPILSPDGRAIAAMSCSVPKVRVKHGELDPQFMAEVLMRQAAKMTPEFGHSLGGQTSGHSSAGPEALR